MPTDLRCPLCQGSTAPLLYAKSELPIRRCSCGMVFLFPRPDTAQLDQIYQSDYYRSWGLGDDNDSAEATRRMKQGTFALRLRRLSGLMAPGRVLDVGCATGFFLEVAERAGWEVHGVELSRYAATEAKRRFGDRIFNGTLEEARYPSGTFALVTLSDILEHIPEPQEFLREVRRILTPGGRVLIVTPDVTSLTARLMGSRWSHYKVEHLHYFSPATITRLLSECGFQVDCREPAAKSLNLAYIVNQFRVYPHALMTPLTRLADGLLPARVKEWNIPLRCGEMLVLARSTESGS